MIPLLPGGEVNTYMTTEILLLPLAFVACVQIRQDFGIGKGLVLFVRFGNIYKNVS